MDFVFNVEPEITPEFARGGRLRPFVYCMLSTQLRFWEERLECHGLDAQTSVVNDQMCRGVVHAGLASGGPGKAEEWLKARGKSRERAVSCGKPPFHGAAIRTWWLRELTEGHT